MTYGLSNSTPYWKLPWHLCIGWFFFRSSQSRGNSVLHLSSNCWQQAAAKRNRVLTAVPGGWGGVGCGGGGGHGRGLFCTTNPASRLCSVSRQKMEVLSGQFFPGWRQKARTQSSFWENVMAQIVPARSPALIDSWQVPSTRQLC